jgi:hypothetical protein
MKLWRISLWLSIASCSILLVIFCLPSSVTVFSYNAKEVGPGILFPVLLLSWTCSLFGFAFNNIYIDKSIGDKFAAKMSHFKLYLPSILGLPAFMSFIWFIIRWYKGKPDGV